MLEEVEINRNEAINQIFCFQILADLKSKQIEVVEKNVIIEFKHSMCFK